MLSSLAPSVAAGRRGSFARPSIECVVALCLGVALLACFPFPARAANASLVTPPSGGVVRLSYTAGAGEANRTAISRDGADYVIDDPGATINPTGGCTPDDPTPPVNHVRCPGTTVRLVMVQLLDGDDELTIADSAYPPEPPPLGVLPVTATGGAGRDTLRGGAGPDDFDGGADDDPLIAGGGGSDNMVGEGGNDTLDGGDGAEESISGGTGDDTVRGGPGDDRGITGGDGNDTVEGGDGNDDVRGNNGADSVLGGEGDDRLDVLEEFGTDPTRGPDSLDGGPGADLLNAGPSPVVALDGTPAPLDPDVLKGGAGIDTADYSARTAPLSIDLGGPAGDGEAGENDDVLEVERVIGGSNGDSLSGSEGAEFLDGRAGDDRLAGRGGDDVLEGGVSDPGGDSLFGGEGRDVVRGGPGDDSLDGGADDDSLEGGGGTDSLTGGLGQDTVAGGPGIDALEGDDGDDTLIGGDVLLVGSDGADEIDGGAGDDILAGGPGNDRLDGGPGADRIGGEDGRDTVSYETRSSPIAVTFDSLPNDGEAGEGDNVASDVEIVLGGSVADTLSGDDRANRMEGGSGEDLLTGLGGTDTLAGGTGNDVLSARDGVRDIVACGEGGDLAIVDQIDTSRDCEWLNRDSRRHPQLGRIVVVQPIRGEPGVRLPDSRRSLPLRESLRIPVGSRVDATSSVVRLTAATNGSRGANQATFSGGAFRVRQARKARALTEVRLTGGSVRACRALSSSTRRASAAAPSDPVRAVWGRARKGQGKFRTRGAYSSGVVRGTIWLTEDRCDGTLTRVRTGTVWVRDFGLRRTVIVRAGESYLARAPKLRQPTVRVRGG